jgi:hypothetical protein
MSAKLTVIFFILICLEIGVLLAVLPWHSSWSRNHLLIMIAERLDWPQLIPLMMNGYVRGAITGLGILNLILGAKEIIGFKKTVQAFQTEWHGDENPPAEAATGIPDNRPANPGPDSSSTTQ